MSNLHTDCLNEIFEYLEEDKVTLRSCLLVNHFWCEVSVRILWRSIRNYNTLITCLSFLSNDLKETLYKNGIITSKPPMFNYSSFCKILSVNQVENKIVQLLKNEAFRNLIVVIEEIFKLLMNQISSLKTIVIYMPLYHIPNFTSFPEAKHCLKNLTELNCSSSICPEIFYQLSQICHNIQSLSINFEEVISNGLADLISVQPNLKYLKMQVYDCEHLTTDIIASLTNLPDTLIKLELYGENCRIPLSFIANLTNLQEMLYENDIFGDFKELQHMTFSHLQVLKLKFESLLRIELLIKFLENNGRNLKEFYISYSMNNSLNLAIAKFCPNLRKLSGFKTNEIEMLKMILNSCQCLESIVTWCCGDFLSEKDILEVIVKHSPKNFHELKLIYASPYMAGLLPKELESIFADWANRIPQKSLSLIVIRNYYLTAFDEIGKNVKIIIDKYIKLGVIKEYKTKGYYNFWV